MAGFSKTFVAVAAIGMIVLIPVSARAGEAHGGEAKHPEQVEGVEEPAEAHHHYRHGLALFLGATNEPGHGTDPTVGLEYAYELNEKWGIGGIVDWAAGDQRNLVVGPAVFWAPFGKGFTLLAAPGIEWHDGRGETEDPHLAKTDEHAVDEDETYFVMRFGAAYWFHIGSRYGIAPAIDLDLVDGHEVWVYGVNFEVMF